MVAADNLVVLAMVAADNLVVLATEDWLLVLATKAWLVVLALALAFPSLLPSLGGEVAQARSAEQLSTSCRPLRNEHTAQPLRNDPAHCEHTAHRSPLL
jgi:hypothetical protein